MNFEWMNGVQGRELVDDNSYLAGQVVQVGKWYIGLAYLLDKDGKPVEIEMTEPTERQAIAQIDTELTLEQWYGELVDEARMEQQMYEREEGWR